MERVFNKKQLESGKWIICQYREITGCAGELDTEEEAQNLADLLNETLAEVLSK